MKFRVNYGASGKETPEVMLVFDEKDVAELRRILDAIEGREGHKAHPAPYVPLYRQHGVDPTAMYPQATKKGNDDGREET